jgi:F-type H+-transporting ATPase subunit b
MQSTPAAGAMDSGAALWLMPGDGHGIAGFVLAQAEEPAAGEANDAPVGPGNVVETTLDEDHVPEEGNFPPFDSSTFAGQLLWLAITFGVLYYLMSKLIIPRIGGILEDRRDRIAADLDNAERLKQQSADAVTSYETALAEARAAAFAIAGEARDRAKAEADARQAEIEADLDRKLDAAEARIAEVKQRALADVGEIATETTEAVVEALLGEKPARPEIASALAAVDQRSAVNA